MYVRTLLQDMELINILYLQDIDLGVGREAFDDLNTTAVSAVEQKELESNKVWLRECGHHFELPRYKYDLHASLLLYEHCMSLCNCVGNWTTRRYANSRIANLRTGQLVD